MGLSFHYSGKIKNRESIEELIHEAADITKTLNWDRTFFGKSPLNEFPGTFIKDDVISGICFSPPECEPVFLCFTPEGNICSPIQYKFYNENPAQYPIEFLTTVSVKTQYAGMEIHKILIKLLKHLEHKYSLNLNVTDEGKYWETDDDEVLKDQFRLYNDLIDNFVLGLECSSIREGETLEEYLIRVAEMTKK